MYTKKRTRMFTAVHDCYTDWQWKITLHLPAAPVPVRILEILLTFACLILDCVAGGFCVSSSGCWNASSVSSSNLSDSSCCIFSKTLRTVACNHRKKNVQCTDIFKLVLKIKIVKKQHLVILVFWENCLFAWSDQPWRKVIQGQNIIELLNPYPKVHSYLGKS